MKQKTEENAITEWFLTYGWAFLVAIIVICVLVYGHITGTFDKITIEKETCVNETVDTIPLPLHLYCDLIGENYSRSLNCIKNAEENCIKLGYEVWHDSEWSFTSYCIINKTEEVCTKEIVGAIEINLAQPPYLGNVSSNPNIFLDMDLEKYSIYKRNELYLIIQDSKITKEWLENNCILEKYHFPALDNEQQLCSECKGEITSLSSKEYVCRCFERYKCFDKYFVSVN